LSVAKTLSDSKTALFRLEKMFAEPAKLLEKVKAARAQEEASQK